MPCGRHRPGSLSVLGVQTSQGASPPADPFCPFICCNSSRHLGLPCEGALGLPLLSGLDALGPHARGFSRFLAGRDPLDGIPWTLVSDLSRRTVLLVTLQSTCLLSFSNCHAQLGQDTLANAHWVSCPLSVGFSQLTADAMHHRLLAGTSPSCEITKWQLEQMTSAFMEAFCLLRLRDGFMTREANI